MIHCNKCVQPMVVRQAFYCYCALTFQLLSFTLTLSCTSIGSALPACTCTFDELECVWCAWESVSARPWSESHCGMLMQQGGVQCVWFSERASAAAYRLRPNAAGRWFWQYADRSRCGFACLAAVLLYATCIIVALCVYWPALLYVMCVIST